MKTAWDIFIIILSMAVYITALLVINKAIERCERSGHVEPSKPWPRK
jgi:hypothetical protein